MGNPCNKENEDPKVICSAKLKPKYANPTKVGEIWDADLTLDMEMPNIRTKSEAKHWSGLEPDLSLDPVKEEIKTLLEKATRDGNLEELAILAGCTLKQRKTVFDKLRNELTSVQITIENTRAKLGTIEELIAEVQNLMVK